MTEKEFDPDLPWEFKWKKESDWQDSSNATYLDQIKTGQHVVIMELGTAALFHSVRNIEPDLDLPKEWVIPVDEDGMVNGPAGTLKLTRVREIMPGDRTVNIVGVKGDAPLFYKLEDESGLDAVALLGRTITIHEDSEQ